MSRSYKHTPRSGQKKDKFFKQYANRRLRQLPLEEPVYNNNTYKKYYCSYNICDYQWVGTSFQKYWLGLLKSWHRRGKFRQNELYPDYNEAYQEYCKYYIRK